MKKWLMIIFAMYFLSLLVMVFLSFFLPVNPVKVSPQENAVSCSGLPFKIGDEVTVTAALAREFGEGQRTDPPFRTGERIHVLSIYHDCRYLDVNGTRRPDQERIKVNVGWWTGSFD